MGHADNIGHSEFTSIPVSQYTSKTACQYTVLLALQAKLQKARPFVEVIQQEVLAKVVISGHNSL